jgi:hypothetical protein
MCFQVDAPCVALVTITDKTLIFHRVTLVWGALLVADPLYIFTEDYLLPAVVKFSGTAVGVVGDILRSSSVPPSSRKRVSPVARKE